MAVKKDRLDKVLVKRGFFESREKAKASILAGEVRVGNSVVDKAGSMVPIDAPIQIISKRKSYVSRGGYKLEAALDQFQIDVRGKVVLDLGASTGGFTDCLLQRGAAKVFAVDVGYGQLHYKLRTDPRVVVLERTNARYLKREQLFPRGDGEIQMVTADLSFISLKLILPTISELLSPNGQAVLLVKPQFEVGPEEVGKGGVVRDPALRKRSADEVSEFARELGLFEWGRVDSPVPGPKGNVEILLWLKREPPLK